MNVSFLLHFYQPPTQDEATFNKVYSESYSSLIKLLKYYKSFKATFNIPLSFLELCEKYGHNDWIESIKDLVMQERIELTGSAAYHPILTEISTKSFENQVILNEYGQGYYFGLHKGFEGENALMLKNITGFFPPEMAVDERVANQIFDFGYDWFICESCSIPSASSSHKSEVYKYKKSEKYIVTRDKVLSDIISFKRDSEIDDIISYLKKQYDKDSAVVLAMDAETFGHHNNDGITLLETMIQYFIDSEVKTSKIVDIIEDANYETTDSVKVSSWSVESCRVKNPLILWKKEDNELHEILWNVLHKYEEHLDDYYYNNEGYETIPIWNFDNLEKIGFPNRDRIMIKILILKTQNSDQFWWSSNEQIGDKKLHDSKLIFSNLDMYETAANLLDDKDLKKLVIKATDKVERNF